MIATRPDAPKLMRAAAMESGGGRDIATVAAAQTYQKLFFEQLNCSTPDVRVGSKPLFAIPPARALH